MGVFLFKGGFGVFVCVVPVLVVVLEDDVTDGVVDAMGGSDAEPSPPPPLQAQNNEVIRMMAVICLAQAI